MTLRERIVRCIEDRKAKNLDRYDRALKTCGHIHINYIIGEEMLKVGERGEYSKHILESDVVQFAKLTGDNNPIHLNEEFAVRTRYGKRIIHGVYVLGLVSTVIGTIMPGIGTIYMAQEVKFCAPAFLGDTLKATVIVDSIVDEVKNIVKLKTEVSNQKGEMVLQGFATVKIPKELDDNC